MAVCCSRYDEMSLLLRDVKDVGAVQEDLEPDGLFHVAIDCPGYLT